MEELMFFNTNIHLPISLIGETSFVLYCAASVLLWTRFLVMGCVKPRGSHPRTKSVRYTPPLLRHSPLSRNLQRV